MENYKHYTVLKETLKIISESHENWFSNHGPHSSDPILNNKENDQTPNIFAKGIQLSFFTEYDQYYKTDYFFGCSFDVYKNTYNKRLEDFKNEFIDANEISFITDELNEGIYSYKFKEFNSDYIDNDTILRHEKLKKQINNSLIKRVEYLTQRAKENGFDLIYNKSSEAYSLERTKQLLEVKKEDILVDYDQSSLNEKIIAINNIEPLKWKGSELELTELSKALIELDLISPNLTQKEIFKRLRTFLQVDDFNENDKLKDIRKRTNTPTPLLNKLETSLNHWIHKKD